LDQAQAAYTYPGNHLGPNQDPINLPPYGTRFRLKASFDTSSYTGAALTIVQALKKYGVIFADQGSNMFISGTTNLNWADAIDQIHSAHPINGSFFEAVQSPYPIVYGYSTTGINITCNGRIQNSNPNWQPPANNETCPGVSTTTTAASTAASTAAATSATLGTSTSASATTSFNSTDNTTSTSTASTSSSSTTSSTTTAAATTTTTTTTTTASGLQYITAQAAFQQSTGISQGATAGIVIGSLVFVGIAAVVVFLLIRRRNSGGYSSSYKSPPAQTEMKVTPAATNYVPSISEDNEKSSFVSQQPSSFGYSKYGKRIPPPPPQFAKGSMIQAKYTQDGKFYRARVDDIQGTQYLVTYVDFGGEQEWLPLESLNS